MLELLHTYTGCPYTGLQHLVLPKETLLLYPSFDSIIIRNSRTLAFIRALAVWEAFPGALHTTEAIRCLSIDPGMKLIVASMGPRIASWTLSGVQSNTWRVYSSLVLPESQHITTIDCKSGLLAVGTASSLAVYTLILENDLPTWSPKWSLPYVLAGLSRVRFSPSLMYIASTSSRDNTVRIYLTTSGSQTQRIRHPRPVTDMNWKQSQVSSRDDLVLYTITSDATLRIFLPVLDAPQHLQLHAALDIFSALPLSIASQLKDSKVFWLSRKIMSDALAAALTKASHDSEDGRYKRVREIKEENWDLFLRVLSDGSLILQAVANIDCRPPTLLKQFTLLHSAPFSLPYPPEHLYILPNITAHGDLTLITSPPVTSYTLSPLPFFDACQEGLLLVSQGESPLQAADQIASRSLSGLVRFVRTADGEAIAALNEDGTVEIWTMDRSQRMPQQAVTLKPDQSHRVDRVVVLNGGKHFITYCESIDLISLYSARALADPVSVEISHIVSLFSIASGKNSNSATLIGITSRSTMLILNVSIPTDLSSAEASYLHVSMHSESSLPLDMKPTMILPVDPMGWSGPYASQIQSGHDDLVSVGADGELAFWRINPSNPSHISWKCSGKVKTQRQNIAMAACSSAKKTVLVCLAPGGQELTVWDSTESEFASGLEYRHMFRFAVPYSPENPILDLDWTATPDGQSILAVGFPHRVELLSQQRMTYFDETPGWGVCHTIDLSCTIPHQISDSIWLGGGLFLIGTGQLKSLYGQPSSPRDGVMDTESLFEHVARHNGPLDDYHPQMILQCLLWEKVELVKNSFVNLSRNLARTRDIHQWTSLPIEDFLKKDNVAKASNISHKPQYSLLFSVPEATDESDEDEFSSTLVNELMENLSEQPLPHLTPNEMDSLLVLLQTTLEIESQRRALDANGLRYMISMRVFYIHNRKLSSPSSPASSGTTKSQLPQRRERLRYRDMVWAFHSESQDILLSTSIAACEGGKMCWPDARALGVYIWLHSQQTMKSHLEVMARNQYMAGDNRDPVQCSLFYFALGKVKLVHGLWRQAAWHKEQASMLKFLNNNFSESRWRTAALKNAFALLSKRRYEYAAAFFLLGGSLKDAVNVCIRNLQDFQLAIALTRVVEGDDSPILSDILTKTVIPTAFKEGNRWLASWAFWLLRRRDLAVRILVTPLRDLATVWDSKITEIGEPHYDDPSLALLFSQLKLKTLQAAKGTSEISGRTEFKFVQQIARVFCRMGCHALALDLVRTWSFARPSTAVHDSPVMRPPRSPLATRFALEPAMRRRSSILIDMDIPSAPPTRVGSPDLHQMINEGPSGEGEVLQQKDNGDLIARKAGMGRLMKSAKQDVRVPEFSMDAFF
ncbi:RAVE protein 1 C terminal-domain-containing protein [Cytidiella melzeri]|nr:RAVE protein 1 C terminal-domain-containing protein [Cytidiella melzeri]